MDYGIGEKPGGTTATVTPPSRIAPHRTNRPAPASVVDDETDESGFGWPTMNSSVALDTGAAGDAGSSPIDALPDIDLPLSFSVETATTTSPQPGPRSLDSAPPSFDDLLGDADGYSDIPLTEASRPQHGSGVLDRSDQLDFTSEWTADREPLNAGHERKDEGRQPLSPRFEFAADFERPERRSWSRRMVQGTLVAAVAAAVAGFIVMMPDEESTSAEGAASAIRAVEDNPTASAELLTASNQPSVEGSLGDPGELGQIESFSAAGIGTPADSGDAFGDAVASAVSGDDEDDQTTTTTTAWVEPTIPPESDWVDSGNGVMVPDLLLRIRFCESTNNYNAANSSSTARGAYQFLTKSWEWYGHAARTGATQAHLATAAQQDESALLTLQSEGTAPWRASRDCWSADDIDPRYATATPAPPRTTTTATDGETTTTEEGQTTTTSGQTTSTPDTTSPDSSSSTTETTEDTSSSTTDGSTTSSSEPTTTTTAPSTTAASS